MSSEQKCTTEDIDNNLYSWASGLFLTNEVPADFREWDTDRQDELIEATVWEPFEHKNTDEIKELIDNTFDNLCERLKTLGIRPL